MVISEIIDTLNAIMKDYGNINVQIYYDKRQTEKYISDPNVYIDDIKVIKINSDDSGVYLSNEFIEMKEYKGCKCNISYDPEEKVYKGTLIPPEYIEGFNSTFSSEDKYNIDQVFHYAVDEYLDFMGNAKITKTINTVKEILDENNLDNNLSFDEYPESDDDDEYN